MPSIIPGYEYDIFISYRHNDNRSGWVTRFVESLRNELAATLKEPVSLYFDENPHDGLLETHDVDGSLKEKIKCLIFIPIISQTYCDTKSFAWQQEFLPFVSFAGQDAIGMDVKLLNGNVTKRVLPIRINDIDQADQALFEKEIDGFMRPVDFVYKSTGVNRALTKLDDSVRESGKVLYQDQINKTANAIKEMLISVQNKPSIESKGDIEKPLAPVENPKTSSRKVFYSVSAILLILVTAYFLFFKDKTSTIDTDISTASIAIIPFLNNTGNPDLDFYGMGMASEIRTQLALTKQFDFISSNQATLAFKKSNESPKEIGQKLGVTYLISGLYQGDEEKLRVVVELVETKSGKILWSLPFNSKKLNIFDLQATISKSILEKFNGTSKIREKPNYNLNAFIELNKGFEIYYSEGDANEGFKSVEHFKKAIELDSTLLEAWTTLIEQYSYFYNLEPNDPRVTPEKIEALVNYIENNFDDGWQKYEAKGIYAYRFEYNFEKAKDLFRKALKENPESYLSNSLMSAVYKRSGQFQQALPYVVKSIQIQNSPRDWVELGTILLVMGDYEKATEAYRKSYELNNESKYNIEHYVEVLIQTNQYNLIPQKVKSIPSIQLKILLNRREYDSLSQYLYVNKDSLDSSTFLEYITNYHYLSGNIDSAKFYSKLYVELVGNQPSVNETLRLMEFNGILQNNINMADYVPIPKMDLSMNWMSDFAQIENFVYSGNYIKATELLNKINSDYSYFYRIDLLYKPQFDRIKEEYPAFQKAINNLKKPVNNTDLVGLKF